MKQKLNSKVKIDLSEKLLSKYFTTLDCTPSKVSANDGPSDEALILSPSLTGKLSCLTKAQLIDLVIESVALLGSSAQEIIDLLMQHFDKNTKLGLCSP